MSQEISFVILLILFLPIDIIISTEAFTSNRHQSKKLYKKYNRFDIETDLHSANDVYFGHEIDQTDEEQTSTENASKPEVDILNCPNVCVCQYAHFFDLPISRWISYTTQNNRQVKQPSKERSSYNEDSFDFESENQALHEYDEHFMNPFIKQATCILEEDANEIELINSLPVDLQALILLYTGIGKNKTVNISSLKPLNQLTTLEIRGTQDRTLRLVFDEPLSFIQHANFESITLLGSDNLKRPKSQVHPSDSFNYKPKSEIYSNYKNDENLNTNRTAYSLGPKNLGFEVPVEEIEILPYNVYMEEMKKARMPSFYGWENIEVLRIHSCNLKELYWEMFDGLVSLEHLSLERNDIVVVTPFAFYGALHIKTLSLAHNHIQDLHYRELAGLLELETLDLSDNRLGKLSELSFPPFPKLERIDFTKNPLKYIFPATFWIMNGTRTMLFDSQELALELRPNEPFESLSKLQELSIENVSISNLEQNIFKGLRSLQKLKLRGYIRKIDFDSFAGLVELQELVLSHCGIDEISMDALIGVRKLQILDLSHNNLSYIPPGLFDDQADLIEIYLQGNKLQILPNTFFMQPKLRLAHLNDNPWKCSCNMVKWKSKITNQKRGSRIERCITDFQTKMKIACRTVDEFKFDKSLTPRCDNYNGRSVYYVMRKQLQCGGGKIIHRQPKHYYQKEMQHNKRYNRQNQKRRNENMIPDLINTTWQKRENEHEKWHTPFDQQMSNEV